MILWSDSLSSEGTFCKHWATKSWKVRDHLSRSARRGGGSLEIMKMTLMGWTDHLGGVTSAISTALMPSAHTSTCHAVHCLRASKM